MHAFVARLPQISQSYSSTAPEGGEGSVDAADEEEGAEADADADAAEGWAERE